MEKRDYVNKAREYFLTQDDVCTAYLFGSIVKGLATASSDVDIGVLFNHGHAPLQRFERKLEIANDLETILRTQVDIIDLESADLYFIHQMMLNKIILMDRDVDRRVHFEVDRRRNYFDRKYFYELYYDQALKRLEEKGRELQNG